MKEEYNELINLWATHEITTTELNKRIKDLNQKLGNTKYGLISGKIKGGNINGYRGEV